MTSSDVTPADSAPPDATTRLRVVVADDDALLREGIASLLRDAGHEVVGRAHDASDLMLKVRSYVPDVAIVDVRMPPGHADDGLVAAAEIRRTHPTVAVLVLSQHLEASYMLELVGDDASGVGYLLKDRVRDVAEFVDAVERVAAGGTAFDPAVVSSLVGRAPRRPARRAHRPRARGPGADRRGPLQPRDRRAALPQPARRRAPRPGHLPEAAPPRERGRQPPRARRARPARALSARPAASG